MCLVLRFVDLARYSYAKTLLFCITFSSLLHFVLHFVLKTISFIKRSWSVKMCNDVEVCLSVRYYVIFL